MLPVPHRDFRHGGSMPTTPPVCTQKTGYFSRHAVVHKRTPSLTPDPAVAVLFSNLDTSHDVSHGPLVQHVDEAWYHRRDMQLIVKHDRLCLCHGLTE